MNADVLSSTCHYGHSKYGTKYGPSVFNLAPSKLYHFNIGLCTSPEGRWGSVYYRISPDKKGYEWASFAWEIEEKLYFWIRFLSFSAPNVSLDAISCAIGDHTPGPQVYGWGPKWESKIVDNIDDVFQFILDRDFLKTAFFPNNEHEALVLNNYVAR